MDPVPNPHHVSLNFYKPSYIIYFYMNLTPQKVIQLDEMALYKDIWPVIVSTNK